MNSTYQYEQGSVSRTMLSVVLIGPDEERRRALAEAFERQQVSIAAELGSYPNLHQLAKVAASGCDLVVVDLDEDPDVALDLVENICSQNPFITVMVCSRRQDPEVLVQCMRAGAREFLSEPVSAEVLAEAIIRASARQEDKPKKVAGKILAFWGVKGGSGVTTLASNFAIALKHEAATDVVLVDLKLQLGDVAVALGLNPSFTLADALHNSDRLDKDFMSSLLVEHKSGLAVLASPDQYSAASAAVNGNLRKILYILRDRFPYVVVDTGATLEPSVSVACEMADTVYLVTQAEIPSLRNAQRLISHIQRPGATERRLELVLNRYDPHKIEIQESQMAKVLPAPVRWKVPNDYFSVCRSLNTGVALASGNSSISRVLCEMAREACGRPAGAGKKRKWGLFD